MTTEERIDRLENRVDRMEDQAREDVAGIHAKIDALGDRLTKAILASSKNECPSPGACVALGQQVDYSQKLLTAQTARVERLELKILDEEKRSIEEFRKVEREFAKIEKQKAWVLGAWSVVAFLGAVLGSFVPIIIKFFITAK